MQSLVAGIHEFLERANQLAAWQSLAAIWGPDFQAFHHDWCIFLGLGDPKSQLFPEKSIAVGPLQLPIDMTWQALSSCGSCYGPGRDRQPLDSVLASLFDVSPLGDADPEAGSPRENSKKQERETSERPYLVKIFWEIQVFFCNMLSMNSDGFGVVLQKSEDVRELRSWESEINWQFQSCSFLTLHVEREPQSSVRLFRWLFFQCMFCARFDGAISIHIPEIQHKNIPQTSPKPDNLLGNGHWVKRHSTRGSVSRHFPQAIRGTQRGTRFLHERRIEEAIHEFHSVCNRVPRTNYYQLMKFEKLKGHFTLETTFYGSNMLPCQSWQPSLQPIEMWEEDELVWR